MFQIGMIGKNFEISYSGCLMTAVSQTWDMQMHILCWSASDWSTAEQKIIIKQNLTIWGNLIVLKLNNIINCILIVTEVRVPHCLGCLICYQSRQRWWSVCAILVTAK